MIVLIPYIISKNYHTLPLRIKYEQSVLYLFLTIFRPHKSLLIYHIELLPFNCKFSTYKALKLTRLFCWQLPELSHYIMLHLNTQILFCFSRSLSLSTPNAHSRTLNAQFHVYNTFGLFLLRLVCTLLPISLSLSHCSPFVSHANSFSKLIAHSTVVSPLVRHRATGNMRRRKLPAYWGHALHCGVPWQVVPQCVAKW